MTVPSAARRPRWITPVALLLFVGFAGLGSWQLQRRVWKLDLIARVEAKVHAEPVVAPGPAHWNRISRANDEYLRVEAHGTFIDAAQSLVQAVTERGAGFWVMTPLQDPAGNIVLVNRGFVPPEDRSRIAPGSGPVTVTGLLRLSEPGGGFLRRNEPSAQRWFSRDVEAIARAHGLTTVAPYFIDAQTTAGPPAGPGLQPVPGLTVLTFHNSHLVYAITWYTLAVMVAGAAWRLRREDRGGPQH